MSDTTILDLKGALITVGARTLDRHGNEDGTVTGISDADGDTNSYGESVGIAPRVFVNYDDGTSESWAASWNATGPWDDTRTDYTCDDVEVAS